MNEPLIDIVAFNQACNRLEVLRGLSNVPDILVLRLIRKYGAIHIREDGLDFRFFDMGPSDA